MPREWMDSINGVLPTPFGEMQFAITQGDHVHISAGSSSDKVPAIVVNGVPYYTSIHLHRQPDGTWAKRPESDDPYMSRKGSVGRNVTWAAQKKAYEGIRKAWTEFIAGDEAVFMEAELRHLNNQIRQSDEDVEKARLAFVQQQNILESLVKAEKQVEAIRAQFIKRGGYPNPRDWSPRGEIPGEE